MHFFVIISPIGMHQGVAAFTDFLTTNLLQLLLLLIIFLDTYDPLYYLLD